MHRHRGEVVDREVEEALDLAGVQVDGDDAVGARGGEHVGDEARGDRLAALGLAVLARVSVERADRGDALRRRALRRVDHDQLLHEQVVDRAAVGLEHEHVGAADVLAVAAVDLAVRERREHAFAERRLQVLGHLVRQRRVSTAGHEDESLLGEHLHQASSSRVGRVSRAGTPRTWRPGPTSWVTTEPAPVSASSPSSTGATSDVCTPGVRPVADLRAVLVLAVVVRGDRARAEVHARSDVGVADVRQVRDLRSLADLGVLDLDVGADLHARGQARPRSDVRERARPRSRRRSRTRARPCSTSARLRRRRRRSDGSQVRSSSRCRRPCGPRGSCPAAGARRPRARPWRRCTCDRDRPS